MKIAFAVLAATALTAVATAQETSYASSTSANEPKVSIGGGVLIRPEYSGADSYETMPLPFIAASKEITPGNTLYLKGLNAGLDHVVTDQLTVGLLGNYRFERDSSDSSRLTGMRDIDGAFEIGPKVRYQLTRQIGLEANMLFDVSDAHDGYTARAGADYALPLSEITMLTANAGLNYGSKDFNNTYYGVRTSEVAAGRPAYRPGSGLTSADASVGIRHALTTHWSVQGNLGADYLLADVADSPLVDRELQPKLMLGVNYTF